MAKAISETVQKAASKYADTLQEIKDEFAKRCQDDKEISSLLARIQSGSGSYEDASEASRRLGSALSKIYTQKMRDAYDINMSADTGEIDEILRQTLKHDYDTITDLSRATQESLNKTAGINMKAVVPEYNMNRTEGIISRVDEFSQRDLDAAMNELETNMENYSMSVVDDSVKANADYQFKAGMVPKVKRILHGFKPCKWCQALAGTYEYPDVPDDVYRRHQNCYCTVTYTPAGSKTSQDVWSKKWGKEQDLEIEQRIKAYSNQKSAALSGGKQYHPMDPSNPRDISAAREYRKISRNNDIARIADSSGFSREDIIQIKRHIFYDKHKKYDGEYGLLVPDYDMAVAWKRLANGKPEERDIVLLNHELLESKLEKEYNLTIAEAHATATKKYDWASRLISDLGEKGEPDGLL